MELSKPRRNCEKIIAFGLLKVHYAQQNLKQILYKFN